MKLIGVGDFVKRQTPESRFSHFTGGSWEDVEKVVEYAFEDAQPGYRDGVKIVPVFPRVDALDFFSGVVEVTADTPLRATFEARRASESPVIVVTAEGKKMPAEAVDVVIYHRDVLAEDREVVGDHLWEIISINARPTVDAEPMHPVAMARNMLHLPGGTKAEYTALQFAEAIMYWSTHAMRG